MNAPATIARVLLPALALAACLASGRASAQDEKPPPPKSAGSGAQGSPSGEKASPEGAAQEPEYFGSAPMQSADDALTSVSRAAKFLLKAQNSDGSWASGAMESVLETEFSVESFYDWQMATVGLCCMALMVVDENPERAAALEKALTWLCSSRLPKRGNHWDIDGNWTSLYGYIALEQAACDARFQAEPWRSKIEKRALEFYHQLEEVQTAEGGWGYYEGPVVSERPTWSTSFSTACVIPAFVDGKAHGWPIDQKVIDRAVEYVRRCGLPNGAYEYDLRPVPRLNGAPMINDVKGSLGRIQVCNWALRRAGDKSVTDEKIRQGLERFFEDHRFLDFARMRPIPHEGYYQNAGYFYLFGHCYAAMVINELSESEREAYHARLRPQLTKVQWDDGASLDFQGSSYLMYADTSFSILALEAGLHPERFARPAHPAPRPAQMTSRPSAGSKRSPATTPAAPKDGAAPKR